MDPKPIKDAPAVKPVDPIADFRKLELGDAELQKRVIAATAGPKAPVIDHWTGKKICHRFFNFVQTEVPDKLNPRVVGIQSNLVNVGCMGVKCSLWDDENKRCLDASKAIAEVRTADALEIIDGLLRMIHDGSN